MFLILINYAHWLPSFKVVVKNKIRRLSCKIRSNEIIQALQIYLNKIERQLSDVKTINIIVSSVDKRQNLNLEIFSHSY